MSATKVYGARVICVVLSGGDNDVAEGLQPIKRHGGRVIVQKPKRPLSPPCRKRRSREIIRTRASLPEEIAKIMETCGASPLLDER